MTSDNGGASAIVLIAKPIYWSTADGKHDICHVELIEATRPTNTARQKGGSMLTLAGLKRATMQANRSKCGQRVLLSPVLS